MSGPKRVLFLLGSMGGGGSERQVVEVLRNLDRDRFLPALYLIHRDGELLDEVPGDVPVYSYQESRSAVPRLNYPGRILLAQGKELARSVHEQRIDVIYDRTSQMTLTAYLARRPPRVARVSVAAGDPQREFATAHYRFSLAKRLLLRRAYRDADRIVAVSDGVARGLVSFFHLPTDKIVTCHNIFDVARIEALANETPPVRSDDLFHVVSVGRLQPEKGHAHLLEAMDDLVHRRGLDQVRLWLIGQGPAESELRAFATSRGLDPFVTFVGFLKNPLPWVRAADLYCLPSIYEGMPNALVEAMFCGTPVLASDCPSGPGEILEGGKYGRLVPPGRSSDLASAIEDATRSGEAWRATAIAARDHADRMFSARRGVERLQSILDAAILERRSIQRRDTEH